MCGAVALCDGSTAPAMYVLMLSIGTCSFQICISRPSRFACSRSPSCHDWTDSGLATPAIGALAAAGLNSFSRWRYLLHRAREGTCGPLCQATNTNNVAAMRGRQWLQSLSTIELYARKAWKHRSPAERALARRRGPLPSLGYSVPAWRPAYWSHPTRHPSGTLASQSGRVDRTLFRKAGTMPCMQGRVVRRLTQDR